jgi:hypothetical protein
MLLLIGGSIAFASQALDGSGRQNAAVASAPPPPPLTLLAPATAVTQAARVDVNAIRPPGLRQDQTYVIRLYVNGSVVRERELPPEDEFVLGAVPLDQGSNSIRASLVGDGGEGQRSPELTITRDDVAPVIEVSGPASGERVYTHEAALVGRTEAGASLTVTSVATDEDIDVSLRDDGGFAATLALEIGENRFLLRSTDVAGNASSSRLTIVRAPSSASLTLSIDPDDLLRSDLPRSVIMTAFVRDEVGQPVDGVEVTFSVSPPDRGTDTYRVTSQNGRARWGDLVIDPADEAGVWLVTALATLPSGLELRQDGSFTLE